MLKRHTPNMLIFPSQRSYITSFAQLPNLTHLTLCLDPERKDDSMGYTEDRALWSGYLCLHVSELLTRRCNALEQIDWVQVRIDSEGNTMDHRFIVEETPDSGRMVKMVSL